MNESVTVKSKGRRVSPMKFIPWTLLLIVYMVAVHYTGIDMTGIAGYIFMGLGMLVLFIEFFKSGDINTWAFLVDLVFALIALIVATTLMSYLYFKLGQQPTFFHWFGYAVILGDAVLSPFNAFRTALRNLGLGASV